ncbi:MAG: hypothetical protein ACI8VW_000561 [bacterium]|jgi:hypothetical protein
MMTHAFAPGSRRPECVDTKKPGTSPASINTILIIKTELNIIFFVLQCDEEE